MIRPWQPPWMARRAHGGRSVWLISPAMEIAAATSSVQHVAFARPLSHDFTSVARGAARRGPPGRTSGEESAGATCPAPGMAVSYGGRYIPRPPDKDSE